MGGCPPAFSSHHFPCVLGAVVTPPHTHTHPFLPSLRPGAQHLLNICAKGSRASPQPGSKMWGSPQGRITQDGREWGSAQHKAVIDGRTQKNPLMLRIRAASAQW